MGNLVRGVCTEEDLGGMEGLGMFTVGIYPGRRGSFLAILCTLACMLHISDPCTLCFIYS